MTLAIMLIVVARGAPFRRQTTVKSTKDPFIKVNRDKYLLDSSVNGVKVLFV